MKKLLVVLWVALLGLGGVGVAGASQGPPATPDTPSWALTFEEVNLHMKVPTDWINYADAQLQTMNVKPEPGTGDLLHYCHSEDPEMVMAVQSYGAALAIDEVVQRLRQDDRLTGVEKSTNAHNVLYVSYVDTAEHVRGYILHMEHAQDLVHIIFVSQDGGEAFNSQSQSIIDTIMPLVAG